MLFKAFAAVVIGGVSLKGGVGALPGVYRRRAAALGSINTAINLMGLPAALHAGHPRRCWCWPPCCSTR